MRNTGALISALMWQSLIGLLGVVLRAGLYLEFEKEQIKNSM